MTRSPLPVIFLAFSRHHLDGYNSLAHLGNEANALQKLLDGKHKEGICEPVVRENVTFGKIADVVQDPALRDRIAVFHFAGIGDEVGIVLENEQGEVVYPSPEEFVSMFAHLPNLKLVFLNVCCGQAHVEHLQRAGIRYIITTLAQVPDAWSEVLAVRFYAGLAGGESVAQAFSTACTSLRLEIAGANARDWQLFPLATTEPEWTLPSRLSKSYDRSTNPYVSLVHFEPRDYLEKRVCKFLDSQSRGYFVLTAKAGMGKTTFLSWLAERYDFVAHFGRDSADADTTAYLRIAQLLSHRWGLQPFPLTVSSATALTEYIADAASERNRQRSSEKIVIVIDGLNPGVLSVGAGEIPMLPQLPLGVYVICGTRPTSGIISAEIVEELVIEEDKACCDDNDRSVRSYIEKRLSQPDMWQAINSHGKTRDEVTESIAQLSEGVWIYLHFFFEQLENVAKSDGTLPLVEVKATPQGLRAQYVEIFAQLQNHAGPTWQSVHLKLVGLLAAVRVPLPLDFVCSVYPSLQREQVTASVERLWLPIAIVDTSHAESPVYHYYHDSLREFVSEGIPDAQHAGLIGQLEPIVASLVTATKRAHADIADYFLRRWGGFAVPHLVQHHALPLEDQYGLEHVLEHLVASQRYAELYALVQGSTTNATTPPITQAHRHWRWPWGRPANGAESDTAHGESAHYVNAWFQVRQNRGELQKYVRDLEYVRSKLLFSVRELQTGHVEANIRYQHAISLEVLLSSIRVHLSGMPSTLAVSLLQASLCDVESAIALTDNLPQLQRRDDALELIARHCIQVEDYDSALRIAYQISDLQKKVSLMTLLVSPVPTGSQRQAQVLDRIIHLIDRHHEVNSKLPLNETIPTCAPLMTLNQVRDAIAIVLKSIRKEGISQALACLLKQAVLFGDWQVVDDAFVSLRLPLLCDTTRRHLAIELAQAARFAEALQVIAGIAHLAIRSKTVVDCAKYASPEYLTTHLWELLNEMPPAEGAKAAASLAAAVPFTLEQEPPLTALLSVIARDPNHHHRVPDLMMLLPKVAPELRHEVETMLVPLIPGNEPQKKRTEDRVHDLWGDQPLEHLSPELRNRCIKGIVRSVYHRYEWIMGLGDFELQYHPQRASDIHLMHEMDPTDSGNVIPARVRTVCDWLDILLVHGLADDAIALAYRLLQEYQYLTTVVKYVTGSLLIALKSNTDKIVRAASEQPACGESAPPYVVRGTIPNEHVWLCFDLIACTACPPQDRSALLKQVIHTSAFARASSRFSVAAAALISTLPEPGLSDCFDDLIRVNLSSAYLALNLAILSREIHDALQKAQVAQEVFEQRLWVQISQAQPEISSQHRYDLFMTIAEYAHPQTATLAVYAALGMMKVPSTQTSPGVLGRQVEMDLRPFVRLAELGMWQEALRLASEILPARMLPQFLLQIKPHTSLRGDEVTSALVFDLIGRVTQRPERDQLYELYLPEFTDNVLRRYDLTRDRIGDADAVAFAVEIMDFSSHLAKVSRVGEAGLDELNAYLAEIMPSLETFTYMVDLVFAVETMLPAHDLVCQSLASAAAAAFRGTDYLKAISYMSTWLQVDGHTYEKMVRGIATKQGSLSEPSETKYTNVEDFMRQALVLITEDPKPCSAKDLGYAKQVVRKILDSKDEGLILNYTELLLDAACNSSGCSAEMVLARLEDVRDTSSSAHGISNLFWTMRILLAALANPQRRITEQSDLVHAINANLMRFGSTGLNLDIWSNQQRMLVIFQQLARACPFTTVESAIATLLGADKVSLNGRAEYLIVIASSPRISSDQQRAFLREAQECYTSADDFYRACIAHIREFSGAVGNELITALWDWLRKSQSTSHRHTYVYELLPFLVEKTQVFEALDLLAAAGKNTSNDLQYTAVKLSKSMCRCGFTLSDIVMVLERYGAHRESLMFALAGASSLACCLAHESAASEIRTMIRHASELWP